MIREVVEKSQVFIHSGSKLNGLGIVKLVFWYFKLIGFIYLFFLFYCLIFFKILPYYFVSLKICIHVT